MNCRQPEDLDPIPQNTLLYFALPRKQGRELPYQNWIITTSLNFWYLLKKKNIIYQWTRRFKSQARKANDLLLTEQPNSVHCCFFKGFYIFLAFCQFIYFIMTQLNLWAQRAVDACMSKVKIPEKKKKQFGLYCLLFVIFFNCTYIFSCLWKCRKCIDSPTGIHFFGTTTNWTKKMTQ